MRTKAGFNLAALLFSLVLLCALALPAGAAEADAPPMPEGSNAVAVQLEQLLSSDIDWRWLPDIEHNQVSVQALLDSYLACTPKEREGFTESQNSDLRGYFEALYTIQGKDLAEIDALFAPPAVSDSTVSSSVSVSESLPDSSVSASASLSQPQSSAVSSGQAASSLPSSFVPVIDNPPQAPGGSGWTALFSGSALGFVLVGLLVLLIAGLFVRFLVSLRRAGKPARVNPGDEARARELFGEAFDEQTLPDADEPDAAKGTPEREAMREAEDERPLSRREQRREERRAKAEARGRSEEMQGDADGDADPFDTAAKQPKTPERPVAPAPPLPETRPAPPPAAPANPPEAKSLPPARAEKKTVIAPGGDVIVQSATSRDPDAPNAISMRSFSGQPRTGRPAKMTFRQGEPGDIDAIDE